MYYIYILFCNNNSFYVGFTDNIKKRLLQHQNGQVRFTSAHIPVRLVYFERHPSKEDAMKREKQLKGWTREKKINLIKYGHPTRAKIICSL